MGLIHAPGGLITLFTAQRFAGQVSKRGSWPIASAGMLLMVLGCGWTLALGRLDDVVVFLIASVIIGVGYTMSFTGANISAVASAGTEEQGLASGMFIASFQVGGGVILGVVASVFGTNVDAGAGAYRSGVVATVAVAGVALAVCLTGLRSRNAPAARVAEDGAQVTSGEAVRVAS